MECMDDYDKYVKSNNLFSFDVVTKHKFDRKYEAVVFATRGNCVVYN